MSRYNPAAVIEQNAQDGVPRVAVEREPSPALSCVSSVGDMTYTGSAITPRVAVEREPSPALSCVSSVYDSTSAGSLSETVVIKGCVACRMFTVPPWNERRCRRCNDTVLEFYQYNEADHSYRWVFED